MASLNLGITGIYWIDRVGTLPFSNSNTLLNIRWETNMDTIIGHHVDKVEIEYYDEAEDGLMDLVCSYDFDEHWQRYELTLKTTPGPTNLTKAQARKLRDFLNGLSLGGRG